MTDDSTLKLIRDKLEYLFSSKRGTKPPTKGNKLPITVAQYNKLQAEFHRYATDVLAPFLHDQPLATINRLKPRPCDEALAMAVHEMIDRNSVALIERCFWLEAPTIDPDCKNSAAMLAKEEAKRRLNRRRFLVNDLQLLTKQIEFGVEKGWFSQATYVDPGILVLFTDFIPWVPPSTNLVEEMQALLALDPHRGYWSNSEDKHPYYAYFPSDIEL